MIDLKSYFHSQYQGGDSFIDNIIKPIFGEDKYYDAYEEDVIQTFGDEGLEKRAESIGITSIKRLGSVDNGDTNQLDIFDITVGDSVRMRNNRVALQLLIRRIMSTYSSAFMVFHYNDNVNWDWRFSFCSKLGSNKEVTEAKRYTFMLGPNYSCRTAADNFQKLFLKAGNVGLDDIVKAFDVEALSKEFFSKYKLQYEKFCNYLYENKDDRTLFGDEFSQWEEKTVRDYVKKLLGRIVFLHFIQKKGWLGVPAGEEWGNGDVQFMMNLFKNASDSQKDDYLDTVLEPIFAEALDKDRSANGDLFDTGVEGFRNIRIPYLNGGLFVREKIDEPKSKFPAEYFASLFEFLYEYNFTIDENDPNDAEMGIDPEMLGRIFENLLEDNKDKGAFYTPKEIVNYMCRESLIAYLTTCVMKKNGDKNPEDVVQASVRELLDNPDAIVPRMSLAQKEDFGSYIRSVKICDPAIGSGAFPMGLLNELVKCRISIDAWAKDSNGNKLTGNIAALKREIISNNIYGVDIEKGAIDIARLRFWLSIIVDEVSPHTLPNFDYKFMQGNSLIPTFAGEYINIATDQQHQNVAKMRDVKRHILELKNKYYTAVGEEKLKINIQIKDSILQLISLQLGWEIDSWVKKNAQQLSLFGEPETISVKQAVKYLSEDKKQVVAIGAMLRNQLNDESIPLEQRAQIDIQFFDWRLMFTEVFDVKDELGRYVGGFDIVIGNPPYVKEYTNRDAFNGIRGASQYYMGKMDLWYAFACYGLDLTARQGVLCFIAQNNWTTSFGAKLMRNKIVDNARILQMLDFNDYMVFGDSASIQTMIMLFSNDSVIDNYILDFRKLKAESNRNDMLDLLNKVSTTKTYFSNPLFNRNVFKNKFILFESDTLLTKISKDKEYFTQDEIAQGIVFPQDFLNRKNVEILNNPAYKIGDGVFGLSEEEYRNLDLGNEQELIRPYFTSVEIDRYITNPNNHLWMIYTDSSYSDLHSLDNYPILKRHLDQFQAIITSSSKPYGLHRARNEKFFKGEKIVSQRKCVGRPVFSYSNFDCYVTQTYNVISTNRWNLKFLTGLLNSTLSVYWFKNKGKMQGENFQIDKEPLLEFPIASDKRYQKSISELVQYILDNSDSYSISDIEKQIDNNVYHLYNLTYEEVVTVDPSTSITREEYENFKSVVDNDTKCK